MCLVIGNYIHDNYLPTRNDVHFNNWIFKKTLSGCAERNAPIYDQLVPGSPSAPPLLLPSSYSTVAIQSCSLYVCFEDCRRYPYCHISRVVSQAKIIVGKGLACKTTSIGLFIFAQKSADSSMNIINWLTTKPHASHEPDDVPYDFAIMHVLKSRLCGVQIRCPECWKVGLKSDVKLFIGQALDGKRA